jgi:hypothetical protein
MINYVQNLRSRFFLQFLQIGIFNCQTYFTVLALCILSGLHEKQIKRCHINWYKIDVKE